MRDAGCAGAGGRQDPRRGGAIADVTDGRALAREFLEQQRLLGGDSVILPDGATPGLRPGSVGPRDSTALTPGVSPGNTQARPAREASDLPPPGISFDPPGGDLFSNDPVPQAGSLEAIAQLVASCTKCRLCEGRRHTVQIGRASCRERV